MLFCVVVCTAFSVTLCLAPHTKMTDLTTILVTHYSPTPLGGCAGTNKLSVVSLWETLDDRPFWTSNKHATMFQKPNTTRSCVEVAAVFSGSKDQKTVFTVAQVFIYCQGLVR